MEITVEITREDYKAWNEYFSKSFKEGLAQFKNPIFRFINKNIFFVYLIFMLIIFLMFNIHITTLIVMLSAIVLAISLIVFEQRRLQKKMYEYMFDDNGSILGRHTYTLTDEGFKHEGNFQKGIILWQGIVGIEATEDHLFVLIDNAAAFIIPKRFFPSAMESREFMRKIEEALAMNNEQ